MRIGSLFSGIGGLELGLEMALDGTVVWQVEREPWPRAVLARHWPTADRSVIDVCEAGASNLAAVDLICGGFPCQDISQAGSGKGIKNGEKSGLWREYARILRELRPRYVVVENSAALPSRGLDVVLGDLASIGYDAQWARIGAVDVGAPHRRWRCFVVAWLPDAVGLGCRRGTKSTHRQPGAHGEAQQLADTNEPGRERVGIVGLPRHEAEVGPHSHGRSETVADTGSQRLQKVDRQGESTRYHSRGMRDGSQDVSRRNLVSASSFCAVADGLPGWMGDGPLPRAIAGPDLRADGRSALRALGNAVVPRVAYEVGLWLRRIIEDPDFR